MQVICIESQMDDKSDKHAPEVPVGDIVTVVNCFTKWGMELYVFAEYDGYAYETKHFIPLSSIDETEMQREYKHSKIENGK